ncbi:oligosaccharide flippase family protein [Planktothrix mougeotii]|uniref:Oligosaccharide flippase family protein n=1 Tax=Planktothrix mougeotii LEGE 06226 TaxID=1828728 RepID=A0ABR9UEF4_9CYAN|nr:oligosaccharide flippase family protein [Planktothrix mougeotii]MBE9144847.1 oligosaccharide flippase family protein [Planktothrix mougeotii LEGE 06226]
MASLSKQAIQGTIWTLFGYGGSQVLRFGGNLILTRLLVPELFGLMALVNTFIIGLNLFSDIGIRPSIIRSQRGDDPEFLNTAWTIQVFRGFGLWITCLLIAAPIASFYNEPQLLWITPIVGFGTVISGFNSTALATLNRNLALGKLTVYDFVIQITSLSVMGVWAWINPTIWALISGTLIGSFLGLIRSHLLNEGSPNRFAWDKKALEEIFSFGRWIFLSTAMTFLATQSDRLILGKLISLEKLGIYTVAYTFADLPRQLLNKISSQVLFPVFSKQMDIPRENLRKKILKKRWFILIGLGLLITVFFGFGDLIILALYDDRYKQAAWMLPILSLGLWPVVLCSSLDKILYAIGKPQYSTVGYFLKFCYMMILLPLSFKAFNILGVIITIACNDIPYYIVVNYGLWINKVSLIKQDLEASLVLIILVITVLGIRYQIGLGLPFAQAL